jgi:phosphate transport system permease protein
VNQHIKEFVEKQYFKRKLRNYFACTMLACAAMAALLSLGGVFSYLIFKGLPSVNFDFFTKLPSPVGETGGGMANALVGSSILVVLASLVGIPWGIATGVYLSEYGRGKLGTLVRFSVDMLASVPSIVVGLFIYVLLVKPMHRFSAIAGGAALAILMIPTVARTTEELLRLVPEHIREAGLALGIPRWKVTLRLVLRGCVAGITTGVMLSIARVAGETAPLLFTALNNRFWHQGLDQPIASLPVQIYTYAISPFDDWNRQAWAGALLLVVFVFTLNIVTRFILKPRVVAK